MSALLRQEGIVEAVGDWARRLDRASFDLTLGRATKRAVAEEIRAIAKSQRDVIEQIKSEAHRLKVPA